GERVHDLPVEGGQRDGADAVPELRCRFHSAELRVVAQCAQVQRVAAGGGVAGGAEGRVGLLDSPYLLRQLPHAEDVKGFNGDRVTVGRPYEFGEQRVGFAEFAGAVDDRHEDGAGIGTHDEADQPAQ